jgi:hypothetical protein
MTSMPSSRPISKEADWRNAAWCSTNSISTILWYPIPGLRLARS